MTRRGFLATASATGMGATLLASLNDAMARADIRAPVPFGSALPLSGFAAADGIEFRHGLELAVEHVNAAGGVLGRPLQLHIEDTKEMGADVVTQAMQRLVDRYKVSAIINGYNVGTNMVEMDVAADNHILFIHYNTLISHNNKVKSDTHKYYGCFQGDPPEYWYGPGVLLFLRTLSESGQWKALNNKVAIVTSANEYSVVIANAIRAKAADYGFVVSLFETVPYPNNQWGPTLAKLRKDPPAAITVTHYLPQDLAQFMLQFRPNPTQSLIYMQYGPSLPAFRQIGKEAVNGVIYSTVIGELPDEFAAPFDKAYKAKYGANSAPLIGSQTYDGVWHWALAAALAGGAPEPGDERQQRLVAEKLLRLIYRGVNGSCRYIPGEQSAYCYPDQVRDPSLGMPHQFRQHQDYTAEPQLIAPSLYATAKFVQPPWVKL